MEPADRQAYDRHIDAIMIQNDVLGTAKLEGLQEGREEGLQEGREKGLQEGREKGLQEGRLEGRQEEKRAIARNMKALNLPVETITQISGLTREEIEQL